MRRAIWLLARGALPAVVVATIIPLVVFYVALMAGSVLSAICASVVYAYGIAAYQWIRRGRVSGMLTITVFMATVRAGAAVAGHVGMAFAVPILETAGFGLMFTATLFVGEPLIVRLARDLVPHAASDLAESRRLIRWLSLVWTCTYLASGGTTLCLLMVAPLPVYMTAHVLTGWFWTGSGVAISVAMCRRMSSVVGDLLKPLRAHAA